ncbi:MAG: hypothetical protein AABW54_00515 [Candidatus Micrarchaeota archaeon]
MLALRKMGRKTGVYKYNAATEKFEPRLASLERGDAFVARLGNCVAVIAHSPRNEMLVLAHVMHLPATTQENAGISSNTRTWDWCSAGLPWNSRD